MSHQADFNKTLRNYSNTFGFNRIQNVFQNWSFLQNTKMAKSHSEDELTIDMVVAESNP